MNSKIVLSVVAFFLLGSAFAAVTAIAQESDGQIWHKGIHKSGYKNFMPGFTDEQKQAYQDKMAELKYQDLTMEEMIAEKERIFQELGIEMPEWKSGDWKNKDWEGHKNMDFEGKRGLRHLSMGSLKEGCLLKNKLESFNN